MLFLSLSLSGYNRTLSSQLGGGGGVAVMGACDVTSTFNTTLLYSTINRPVIPNELPPGSRRAAFYDQRTVLYSEQGLE